jgi:transposase-like protein
MYQDPQACPFCQSPDPRLVTGRDLELSGFRCGECMRVFYVATAMPLRQDPPRRTAKSRTH